MNITVLTGSPHKDGTSMLMAEEFEKGAKSTGNKVVRFDTAFMNIEGCKGCNYCKSNNGKCVQVDNFDMIKSELMTSDMVVLVTPLYYFDMSSQLKKVIDRFHAIGNDLRNNKRKAILISTCGSPDIKTMEILKMHYEKIIDYLEWQNTGEIMALGVPTRDSIELTDYPKQAMEMGKGIR